MDAIEKNKRDGLLCACNQTRVPYGPPPGTTIVDGVEHGFEYCTGSPQSTYDGAHITFVEQITEGPNEGRWLWKCTCNTVSDSYPDRNRVVNAAHLHRSVKRIGL